MNVTSNPLSYGDLNLLLLLLRWILMGIKHKILNKSYRDYWSKTTTLPFISSLINLIYSWLAFIRMIILLCQKMGMLFRYTLQNPTYSGPKIEQQVHESNEKFKGRTGFKQYMPKWS